MNASVRFKIDLHVRQNMKILHIAKVNFIGTIFSTYEK